VTSLTKTHYSGDPTNFNTKFFEFDPGKSDPRPKVLTALSSTRGKRQTSMFTFKLVKRAWPFSNPDLEFFFRILVEICRCYREEQPGTLCGALSDTI
jgi:hypothetical protein